MAQLGGILFGDRVVEWVGHAHIVYATYNITCELGFDANNGILGKSTGDDIKGLVRELCVSHFNEIPALTRATAQHQETQINQS